MNKAIFLDRDGTLIPPHVKGCDEVDLIPDVVGPLQRWQSEGYKLVLVSNQPDISRGTLTRDRHESIHGGLIRALKREGIHLDKVYYCPHTREEGCPCRKPKGGMLEAARRSLDLDMSESWIVGDQETDIEAGRVAGVRGIRLTRDIGMEDAYRMTRRLT